MLRRVAITISLLLMISGAAFAADPPKPPSKEAQVRQLLDLMGMKGLFVQMQTQLFEGFAEASPEIPKEFWDRLKEKESVDELYELMIPIYEKYYSSEDLDAMIVFYKSPTGQKVIATLPQVMSEAMTAGQKWGEQKGKEVFEEMQKSGFKPKS